MKHTFRFFAVLAIGALICTACTSNAPKEKAGADSQNTVSQNSPDNKNNEEETAKEKQIVECKAFLEEFYNELDKNPYDENFIKKHITKDAKQWLIDHYDYDCNSGDCIATWLLTTDYTGDEGPTKELIIESVDENTYTVSITYDCSPNGDYKYGLKLGLVKEGDSYKINTIESMYGYMVDKNGKRISE